MHLRRARGRNWGRVIFEFWGVLLALGTAAAGQAPGELPRYAQGLSSQEKDLLEECRPNYERLKEFYNNVKMEAVLRKWDFPSLRGPDNPEGKGAVRFEFRANAGKFLRMDSTTLTIRDESPTHRQLVRILRPEGFLLAEREGPDKGLAIRGWTDNANEGWSQFTAYEFQWSPFSNGATAMEWFLFKEPPSAKGRVMESVATSQEGVDRLVTVTTRGPGRTADEVVRGRFVFFRDRSWALKETSWGFASPKLPSDSMRQARYAYEGQHEGVPLLKRVEYWVELGPERRRTMNERYDVLRIEPGPVPEDEFTSSALGVSVGAQRYNWSLGLWLVLTGVVLTSLYFVLRRRERKAAA